MYLSTPREQKRSAGDGVRRRVNTATPPPGRMVETTGYDPVTYRVQGGRSPK